MDRDNLSAWSQSVKQFIESCGRQFLWWGESYPHWYKPEPLLTYGRTSPRATPAYFSHDVQLRDTQALGRQFGRTVATHIDEIGVNAHRLSWASRPGLMMLVARARQSGCPIVVWDLSRLIRDVKLLPKLAGLGVHFVTVKTLFVDPQSLHSERVTRAQTVRDRYKLVGSGNIDLGRFLDTHFVYQAL